LYQRCLEDVIVEEIRHSTLFVDDNLFVDVSQANVVPGARTLNVRWVCQTVSICSNRLLDLMA
jgi:hypothetical protein